MTEAFHNHSVTAATILRISQVPPMTVPVTIAADADVNAAPLATFAAAFTVFTATFAALRAPLTFAVVAGLSGRLGRGSGLIFDWGGLGLTGRGRLSAGGSLRILLHHGALGESGTGAKKKTSRCETDDELFHYVFLWVGWFIGGRTKSTVSRSKEFSE